MKTPRYKLMIVTILLSIVLGAGNGVLATALTSNYLSDYALQLQNLTTPLRLTEKRPTVFPSSYQEAIDRAQEVALPTVVSLLPNTQPRNGFSLNDRLGSGVILTSDGWVAVLNDRFISSASTQVLHKRETYAITEQKVDTLTDVHFLKMDTHGLPVTTFGSALDTSLQEQVFIAQHGSSLVSANVIEHDRLSGRAVSSVTPTRRVVLDRAASVGDPVFNLAGELIGLIERSEDARAYVLPIDAILPAFNSLLESGVIERGDLGMTILDLTYSIATYADDDRTSYGGALIHSFGMRSPAQAAGLRIGDIILSLDGQTVNGHRSLDEQLASYQAGDQVNVTLERKGEVLDIEVVLDAR